MSMLRPFLLLLAIAALAWGASIRAADPLKPEDFSSLHALIKPQEGEWRWAEIPWETSLWEARRKAAEEGKPILLWEMDGNPLGCT